MTGRRSLSPLLAKEVRALLPAWLVALAVVGTIAAVNDTGALPVTGSLVYGAVFIAIGAISIGHEYMHGTLPWLLGQPTGRARAFMVKFAVLAVMLTTLALAAWSTLAHSSATATVIVACVLCGVFVAPLLTMLTRSPVAGFVFTFPLPAWVLMAVQFLVPGPQRPFALQGAMVGLFGIAALASWRTFMRLEAVDGRGMPVHWTLMSATAAPARRQRPIWLLVKKELGLQQLTFVVAAIYLVSSIRFMGDLAEAASDVYAGVTVLCSGALALLAGSLASAEERQLGTLDAQLLLPVAAWKQWTVKAGVVLGVSMMLAFGLPAFLIYSTGGAVRVGAWYAAAIVGLTLLSLYVSSLCASGMSALLISLPAAIVFLFAGWLAVSSPRWHLTPLPLLLLAGFVAILLYFSLLNHRSSEHGAARISQQAFCLVGWVAFSGALVATLAW